MMMTLMLEMLATMMMTITEIYDEHDDYNADVEDDDGDDEYTHDVDDDDCDV